MSTNPQSTTAAPIEHRIGSLAALRAGPPISAVIDGRRVAVFAVGDAVIATTGKCPHAGGPLAKGTLEGAVLTCPWHGWSYDLKTGACAEDPDLILERYPVRIDQDDILVLL